MAKLKALFAGENLKKFFLKHGEKLILGFVCLFVLSALAGTTWVGYRRPPLELVQNLDQAKQRINSSSWPEEEQQKFPPLEVEQSVNTMLADMSDRQFTFSTNYIGSVFGAKEPRREPDFLPVVQLIASSGRTVLGQNMNPAPAVESGIAQADSAESMAATTPDPDDNLPDDIRARPEGSGLAGGMPGMEGMEGGMGVPGNPFGRGRGRVYEETVSIDYDPGAMLMDEMGQGGMASNVKGVPVRYISVRGIFDLRKQSQNYAKALGIPESEASRLVEFLDFALERQVADSTQGPWSEWEPVDQAVAHDAVRNAITWDNDVVSAGVRDSVITMPLPHRLIGVWRNLVNHPAVKNFELTEAEIEAEMVLNRRILEQAREQNKTIKQRRAPGGFATEQLDMTNIQRDFFNETDTRQLNRTLESEFQGTPVEVRNKLINKIKEQVSAAGNLVLFRYIDFDLQPGKSYRYRVRLLMSNPNYEIPVEQVAHPSVAEGEIRETPYSDSSNVASVDVDYSYFLTRVNPPRGAAGKQADMQIYQWYDKTGTMIKGTLSLEPGDFISGTIKTHVLDPAVPKFEEEEKVPLTTNDLLVDALVFNKLDTRLHPDLKLPRSLTRGELGIVPQVLVADQQAGLRELNSQSTQKRMESLEALYTGEKKPFESIKDMAKNVGTGSALDALAGGMESPEMMAADPMMEGVNRLRGRRRNPSRRQMMGAEAGMGPGMVAPGMMGP